MKNSSLQRRVRVALDALLKENKHATVTDVTEYLRENDKTCRKLKKEYVARLFTPQLVDDYRRGK